MSSTGVTRSALESCNLNAPNVAVIPPRTTSKLPVMSKLPKPQFKRHLPQEDSHKISAKKPKVEAPVKKTMARKIPEKKIVETKKSQLIKKQVSSSMRTHSQSTRLSRIHSTRGQTARGQPLMKAAAKSSKKAAVGAVAKKRPAWDLKGRLSDMEKLMEIRVSRNTNLQRDVNENSQQVESLQVLNEEFKSTIVKKDQILSEKCQLLMQLEKKLRDLEDESESMKRKHRSIKEDLESRNSSLEMKNKSLKGELEVSVEECIGLKRKIAQITSSQVGLEAAMQELKQTCIENKQTIARLEQNIASYLNTIQTHEANLQEAESVRRKLHNTVQELKGNIRVFCRVRPLLPAEKEACGEMSHLHFTGIDDNSLEIDKVDENCSGQRKQGDKKYSFRFDKVFKPDSTQGQVFEEISQMVQSALDGYNVCIFAYGQTGSGKTYTMEGPNHPDVQTIGMIPRAVAQIFTCIADLENNGWKYTLEASFLEIYNEMIHDLLVSGDDKLKHEVKADSHVTNLTLVPVSSEHQVTKLLETATCNRSVAATNCNERSSRSHSVFRLKLNGSNQLTEQQCEGTLNLIDLAGSERLNSSGSSGERLRETKNINKSLSNLGNVIMALGNKESHIPYRNSKLTYLLQNSLGGNSKTLMFVNISPREENFAESLCSLRFATKVNQCNIGTAQKK